MKTLSLFGVNQFAYTKARGARDALAFFVLSSLLAFACGEKVAFYQADVAGAFDRVDSKILLQKCRRVGLHPKFLKVLSSWLCGRTACVVAGGKKSELFAMSEMVFQGTVLGPLLWNIFFKDAGDIIREAAFKPLFLLMILMV